MPAVALSGLAQACSNRPAPSRASRSSAFVGPQLRPQRVAASTGSRQVLRTQRLRVYAQDSSSSGANRFSGRDLKKALSATVRVHSLCGCTLRGPPSRLRVASARGWGVQDASNKLRGEIRALASFARVCVPQGVSVADCFEKSDLVKKFDGLSKVRRRLRCAAAPRPWLWEHRLTCRLPGHRFHRRPNSRLSRTT